FMLASMSDETQRLVVDYAIHYVKKSGVVSAKVFKLKTVELAGGAVEWIRKRQLIANFTTRTHYPGRHEIEILVNGKVHGRTAFELSVAPASR
ncbi:MAG TPA: DNA alkylation repair protein, partial [Hyphomicrobiales bacterium]|nr:DNA alkylation repair protein [Hyphomicrobiales bacterium]